MTSHLELLPWLDEQLQPRMFRDYGPNGLQVEGRRPIRRLVTAVTASHAAIEAAVAADADALLVHHGLFWRGQSGCITGWMRERLALLLKHNMHLLAYHLPLDAHPQWGNNAQWAQHMDWQVERQCGEQNLLFVGHPRQAIDSARQLADQLQHRLDHDVVLIDGRHGRPIQRLAWCSGGAQSYFEAAIEQGVDAFVTGEISEPQAHLARECGVAFLACGHHATERFGAPALGAELARVFGLEHRFLDLENPA